MPTVGQPFSPYKQFLAVMLPVGLLRYHGIPAEAKLLLARLYLYAGKKDHTSVSIKTLATDFGVTADSISRMLQKLVDGGFIRRERKARAVAVCRLLFHPSLTSSLRGDDSTPTPNQTTGNDSTQTPDHKPPMIRRGCADDSTPTPGSDSTCAPNAYRDEEVFLEEVYEETPLPPQQTAVTEQRMRRTDQSLSDENLEALRASWKSAYFPDRFTSEGIQNPTRKQVARAIARFERGAEEMAVYLEHFPSRKLKPKSYEYLFTDVSDYWPDIKGDLEKEVEQENVRVAAVQAARLQHEDAEEKRHALHRACRAKGWRPIYSLDCAQCGGFGRVPSTEAVCTCAAGVEYARLANLCPKCGESGYLTIGAWNKARWEWCDCHHAQKRREQFPEYVDNLNAELRAAQAKIDRANGRATA